MASSDRFVAVDEEEMERLLSDKDSKNTKRKISSSLKYFRTFLAKNYQNDNFESFTCDVLDDRLKAFYASWRKTDAGILLLGVWCKNIRYNIPIITLVGVWPDGLSPLEKLGHPRASPRVTLLFSGRQTVGSHSNKGDNCIRSWKRQTKGIIHLASVLNNIRCN